MNTCQIQQTTKTLKFVPANNTSLKVVFPGMRTVEYQPIFHGVT